MGNSYEKKVRDLMIPIYDFPTVSVDAALKDAVRVLMNSYSHQKNKPRTGRQCVFVVADNELVGTIGVPELLMAIEPRYTNNTGYKNAKVPYAWAIPYFWGGLFTDRCKEVADKKIKDFMRPIEKFVDINDSLIKAAYYITENKVDAVAVKNGVRLAGMVRSIDIFREISRLVMADDYYNTISCGWPTLEVRG